MRLEQRIKLLTAIWTILGILIMGIIIYLSYVAWNSDEFDRYGETSMILDNGSLGTLVGTENNHPNNTEMVIFKFINKKANYIDW
ncbi:MAG: hypothetical protein WCW54_00755 [Candidatus Paceibacterota bacterium]